MSFDELIQIDCQSLIKLFQIGKEGMKKDIESGLCEQDIMDNLFNFELVITRKSFTELTKLCIGGYENE